MNCVSETITKMIESLPLDIQERVLEEIQPIISDAIDEAKWQAQFEETQDKLVATARKVKEDIAAGKVKPMNYERL